MREGVLCLDTDTCISTESVFESASAVYRLVRCVY